MLETTNEIEDMPALSKRLGKRKVNKIKYVSRNGNNTTNRTRTVENTVIDCMQDRSIKDTFCPVNDIISGVSRLDHYGGKGRNIPLSMVNIYTILQCLDRLSTPEIMNVISVGERQAQVYLRACKIIIPMIEKNLQVVDVSDPMIEAGLSDVDW